MGRKPAPTDELRSEKIQSTLTAAEMDRLKEILLSRTTVDKRPAISDLVREAVIAHFRLQEPTKAKQRR